MQFKVHIIADDLLARLPHVGERTGKVLGERLLWVQAV
jgi:hypothetical protein